MLIENQKRFVKLDNNVDEWVRALLRRFKKSSFIIMTVIIDVKYIMNDACRKREFIEYAQIIIRATRLIEMSIFSQITFIYNDIELKLRRNLVKSIEFTTMNVFMQKLKNNKKLW